MNRANSVAQTTTAVSSGEQQQQQQQGSVLKFSSCAREPCVRETTRFENQRLVNNVAGSVVPGNRQRLINEAKVFAQFKSAADRTAHRVEHRRDVDEREEKRIRRRGGIERRLKGISGRA